MGKFYLVASLLLLSFSFVLVSNLLLKQDKIKGESIVRNNLAKLYIVLFCLDFVLSIVFFQRSVFLLLFNIIVLLAEAYRHERLLEKFYYE